MSRSFSNQVVLVTGASKGLGAAIALAFAREGAKVVIAARSKEGLAQVERQIAAVGGEALAIPTDITQAAAVAALVAQTLNRFGRIDVLVNNAGIGRVGALDEPSFAADVEATLRASLYGMIAVTQAVLPILRRQGSGTIVNMSSVMGRKAFARFGSYAVVMHAVSALSGALRQELRGAGIKVSVIHPALTATDLLREARVDEMPPPFRHLTPLTPERVAKAVVAAVRRGKARVVLPWQAQMLLLGEAISPRLGDWTARALAQGALAKLLGLSAGATYHEAISRPPAAAPAK
jgi:short-subunit dehydrogenase